MSLSRRVARPLLASIFVVAGTQSALKPGPRVELVRAAGLSEPERLVRLNGAVMALGGLALAAGRLPRLAALTLAGALVPTTYVGHAFWSEKEPAGRRQQQVHFLKNLSVLGGLLLAAADTDGRESVPHATRRLSRRAARRAARAVQRADPRD